MKAKYITLPKLSPYIDFKKYKIFKENHKFFIKELSKFVKKKNTNF